jgi:hypothetical protein
VRSTPKEPDGRESVMVAGKKARGCVETLAEHKPPNVLFSRFMAESVEERTQ